MTTGAAAQGTRLVLDLDPDLGSGIAPDDWESARQACRGTLVYEDRGVSRLADGGERDDEWLGFLIVEGLLCRELTVHDRRLLELLGPGDFLQKPFADGSEHLANEITMTFATEAALLALGPSYIRAAGQWPSLMTALLGRIEAQHERLAIQGLIAHLPRAEHRLLVALGHLAYRWGRMTPKGRLLPLPLTHDILGQLTAARRSTVTLAVSALESGGQIRRFEDGTWLLTPDGIAEIDAITRPGARSRTLGERLMTRLRTLETRTEAVAPRAEP